MLTLGGVGVSNTHPCRKCTAVTCGPRARLGYRRARAHNRVSGANPRRSPSAAARRYPPDAGSCACGPLINKRQQRAPRPRARARAHTRALARVLPVTPNTNVSQVLQRHRGFTTLSVVVVVSHQSFRDKTIIIRRVLEKYTAEKRTQCTAGPHRRRTTSRLYRSHRRRQRVRYILYVNTYTSTGIGERKNVIVCFPPLLNQFVSPRRAAYVIADGCVVYASST